MVVYSDSRKKRKNLKIKFSFCAFCAFLRLFRFLLQTAAAYTAYLHFTLVNRVYASLY